MAKRKTQAKPLIVDATGLHLGSFAPTRAEVLAHGTGQDMRGVLRDIAQRLSPTPVIDRNGNHAELPAMGLDGVTRDWLIQSLERIASGEDPNKVFRLKLRTNADYKTLREKREIEYQFASLREQGATPDEAFAAIAGVRLWDDPASDNSKLMFDKAIREAQKVKRIKSKKLK